MLTYRVIVTNIAEGGGYANFSRRLKKKKKKPLLHLWFLWMGIFSQTKKRECHGLIRSAPPHASSGDAPETLFLMAGNAEGEQLLGAGGIFGKCNGPRLTIPDPIPGWRFRRRHK